MNNYEFICKECGKHYYDVEDGGICPDCLIKYIKDLGRLDD